MPTTICPACGQADPDEITVDFGIGYYEYWGAPGFDSHPCQVTRCCETEAEPFWPEPIEPDPNLIPESEVA